MVTTDESYAQTLRERAELLVPRVDVDLDAVVPRARRRRGRTRAAAGAVAVSALVAATWGVGSVLAAGPTHVVAPADASTPAPAATSGSAGPVTAPGVPGDVPGEAVVADDGSVSGVPGDPWDGDAPYWYTVTEYVGTDGQVRRSESWKSRERPGLLMSDRDVATATAIGPVVVLGRFVLDGQVHDVLTDPRALPVDPVALERVLRNGTEPDRRAGTDDDKAMSMARDALLEGGLLPRDLRTAFWDAAVLLPGAEVVPGESRGRAAEVLTYRAQAPEGASYRLVRDPVTGLLLEDGSLGSPGGVVVDQGPAGPPPVEPTLAMAGCTSWATC
ncbi:hypothetical protein GC089_05240 [Cellulomonas sp. JZ18]|uniref:hypothetical protein n=1 Tax=Cellulomonas sp. JZ18 TaxID=2654191 RepID=UPI0012D43FF4|nr:hypothetical protein [Cellulomonas sp. JZ18]QGQ18761.1 hypothetical protein GC089_05240 [Cellulomonas sp. JZ18]